MTTFTYVQTLMIMKMVMVTMKHMSPVIKMEVSFISIIFAENFISCDDSGSYVCVCVCYCLGDGGSRIYISAREYYTYLIQIRDGAFVVFLCCPAISTIAC